MELGAAQSLAFLGPELALAASALVIWCLGRRRLDGGPIGLVGASLSFVLAAGLYGWGEVWLCDRLLVVDGVAIFAKLVIALAVVAALWIDRDARAVSRFVVAGLALELVASTANTWMAGATLELASLALPVRRTRLVSPIATLAIVAALGWVTGLAGSGDFEILRAGLFEIAPRHGLAVSVASSVVLGATLVRFVSMTSRLDSFGSGLLVAVALPAGILALLSRFFFGALSEPAGAGVWLGPPGLDWRPLLAFAAGATMVWGSTAVLRASSYAQLLGASSIANVGYALVGLSAATVEGLRAALFFLGVSAVATIGAFLVSSLVADDFHGSRGLLRGRGFLHGGALVLFLVSIGAAGRAPVLATAVAGGEPALAGLAMLSVGSLLLAYARVFRMLLTPASEASLPSLAVDDLCCLALLAFAMIIAGLHPEPLVRFASRSAHLLPF